MHSLVDVHAASEEVDLVTFSRTFDSLFAFFFALYISMRKDDRSSNDHLRECENRWS